MRLLPCVLFAGGLGLLLTCVEPASAQKKTAKKGTSQPLVHQLETIRSTLNMAIHDYSGHRANAVHQISHAIHLLKHSKKHPNPGETFVAGKGGTKENQAQSDMKLQQAMTALQGLTVPAGKHHDQVVMSITMAVNELKIALTIK